MASSKISELVDGTQFEPGDETIIVRDGVNFKVDPTKNAVQAWVNFNGTGTVAIRESYNVSSITDNGTGDYTVNFTNALTDANYAVNVSAPTYTNTNNQVTAMVYGSGSAGSPTLQSTTQVRVCYALVAGSPTTFYDPENYYVAVIR